MSSWNQFQYDSADLPFLPNSDTSSLESSTPFWKVSSITEMEKSFTSSLDYSDKQTSPFMKLLNASSRSHENVSDMLDNDSVSPLVGSFSEHQHHQLRRASQSLPATPLTTPAQTPLSTPAPTPNPTPQSSPLVLRKTKTDSEMDAVCKAAIRCSGRLSQDQLQQQNVSKWFYLGFLPQGKGSSEVCVPSSESSVTKMQQLSRRSDVVDMMKAGKANEGATRSSSLGNVPSNVGSRNGRRKCGFMMSNRDMNFMAPTSM